MDSILEALKARTSTLHAQLEQRLDLPARLQNATTFQQVLKAFYGFYAPVEAKLGDVLNVEPVGIDFEQRRKTSLIVADLNCWRIGNADLAICDDVPKIDSRAEALGCMYVLEGATLGGQIIKRLLWERLSIGATNGGSFFTAYGDQVRTMWNEFREAVSQYANSHPDERELILASASETFAKFDAWLGKRLT